MMRSLALPNWLRWLLVVPAAICGSFIATLAYAFMALTGSWGMGLNPAAPINRVYTMAIAGFVSGYAAVWCAGFAAPRRRRETMIVTSAGALVVAGAIATMAVAQRDWWGLYQVPFVAWGALRVGWKAHAGDLGTLVERPASGVAELV